MTLLSQFKPAGPAILETITQHIKDWSPGVLETEREYEASLYGFLHAVMADTQITRQFAVGRIRADIVVGNHTLIEIKNCLDSTGKYHRLIGQITDFGDWGGDILIVLCGQTDPHLRKKLIAHLKAGRIDPARRVQVIDKKTERTGWDGEPRFPAIRL
ncbi:MAG: hypothetical protein MI741_10815 [Rhodospirillales bacterium]|nr:hypothetical protein [Rhodospirillales bacterium]